MPGVNAARPVVVMVHNVRTPYRLALHDRLDREIPGVDFRYVFTHDRANQAWELRDADPSRVLSVGMGDGDESQGSLRTMPREWTKGGRIIREMLAPCRAAAVVLGGYNDPGRIRVLAWCRRRGVPVLLFGDSNIHDDHAGGPRGLLKRVVVGAIVRRCAAVLPCGTAGAAYFARYGSRPERTFFAPYQPDPVLFTPDAAPGDAEAGRRLGLDPDRRRIVFCARLVKRKRADLALAAFAAIAGERPDWDLIVIGDGPERAGLEASARGLFQGGGAGRVRFLGFVRDPATLAAVYRASGVFVHPADQEPWGIVVEEAVGCGLAAVCTRVVGAAIDLVRDGVNGRLVDPGDAAGLASALREVTAEPALSTFRMNSPLVLADWRRRGDPVEGTRRALRAVGVNPIGE